MSELAGPDREADTMPVSGGTPSEVLEAGRIGWWIWELETDSMSWSDNLEEIYGLPTGSLQGTEQGFHRPVHPDDLSRMREAMDRAVRQGTDYDVDFRVVPSVGAPRWINDRGRVISREGRPVRLIATSMDVGARKGREQLAWTLAAVVRSSHDAIVSKDLNGQIRSWNSAAERLFGYSAQEAVGQSIRMLLPPSKADDFFSILDRIRRGERVEHYETLRRRKDGSLVEVSLTISPVYDENGAIIGASKIARDLTAAKEAERERERTRELFLASLGHDLRNPLNTITVSLYSLQRHASENQRHASENQRRVVSRMLSSATRMTRMIEQLLDFTRARLSGVGIGLLARPGDLREIAASVVDEVEAGAPGRFRLRCETSFGGLWDGDRLGQVFANLLSNALDHGAPGEPIEMSMVRQDGWAVVEVKNSGMPIPPDLLGSIFEPFKGTDTKVGKKKRGLGLGLYITREIVRSHGGGVAVRSNDDETVFTVRLPIRPVS
jgi:PAS domain S-box-containing protein